LELTWRTPATYSFKGPVGRYPYCGDAFVDKKNKKQREIVGFLGVGLDNSDGHKRLTRNSSFLLVGGSKDTHAKMQEVSIRFNESLDQRGKRLDEASTEEVIDLMRDALDD
jgi:hypothetical protein